MLKKASLFQIFSSLIVYLYRQKRSRQYYFFVLVISWNLLISDSMFKSLIDIYPLDAVPMYETAVYFVRDMYDI